VTGKNRIIICGPKRARRQLPSSSRGAALMSVLDVDENAEGPPAWERNPRNIASWHDPFD